MQCFKSAAIKKIKEIQVHIFIQLLDNFPSFVYNSKYLPSSAPTGLLSAAAFILRTKE